MSESTKAFFRRIRLRIRLAWLAETAQLHAPYLGVLFIALFVGDWLTGWDGALVASAALAGTYLLALLVGMALIRITPWDASRAAERGLGARSALTTALEFSDPENEIHIAIQQRAEEIAATARASEAIPISVNHDRLRKLALASALAVGIGLLPPLGSTPALSSDAEAAIEAEAEEVERLAEAVDETGVDNSEEIASELRDLARQLREARSLEQALESLSDSEKRLTARIDPQFLSQKAAVQGLARDLALRPLVPDAPIDAASQLEELAGSLGDLSEPELRALQDRLDDLAGSQAAGNASLASQLAKAADALSGGDLAEAREALRNAAAGQDEGLASARGQQALSETARALGAIESRLSGEDGSEGQGEGEGQGQGEGEGQGQGQGQAGGEGGQAGGGPSGTISGVSPGDGNATGQGGQGSVGAGSSGESASETKTSDIYDPVDLGSLSDLIQVDIEGGSAEGDLVGRGEAPTQRGESVVPYAQVLPQYLNEAADSLSTLQLPPSMRGIVQSYFDQLADEAR